MNTDVETDLRFQDHVTLCRVTFDFSTQKNNKDAAIPSKRMRYKENVLLVPMGPGSLTIRFIVW